MSNGFLENLRQKPPAVKKMIAFTVSAVVAGIAVIISLVTIFSPYKKPETEKSAIDIKRQDAITQIKDVLTNVKSNVKAGGTDIKESLSEEFGSSTSVDLSDKNTSVSATTTATTSTSTVKTGNR